MVLLTTGHDLPLKDVVEAFVSRWSIEVTFKESREHLGIETQRQWSEQAINKETPILFGLYSIVVLYGMKSEAIPISKTAWYQKTSGTFSDVLSFVRG